MKRNLLFFGLFFATLISSAQDNPFQIPTNGAMQSNSAFIGRDTSAQVGISYSNEKYASIKQEAIGGYLYTYIPQSNGYLGVSFARTQFDVSGKKTLSNSVTNLYYGQNIRLAKEVLIRLGVQAGVIQRNLNRNALTYGDMIDPERGFIFTTQDKPRAPVNCMNYGVGLMFYAKRFFAAGSIDYINQPNISLIEGTYILERKWSGFLSYDAHIGKRNIFHVQPFATYSKQMDNTLFYGGLNLKYRSIQAGFKVNNPLGKISQSFYWVGYQGNRLGITLGYYKTLTKFTVYSSAIESQVYYRFGKFRSNKRLVTTEGIYF